MLPTRSTGSPCSARASSDRPRSGSPGTARSVAVVVQAAHVADPLPRLALLGARLVGPTTVQVAGHRAVRVAVVVQAAHVADPLPGSPCSARASSDRPRSGSPGTARSASPSSSRPRMLPTRPPTGSAPSSSSWWWPCSPATWSWSWSSRGSRRTPPLPLPPPAHRRRPPPGPRAPTPTAPRRGSRSGCRPRRGGSPPRSVRTSGSRASARRSFSCAGGRRGVAVHPGALGLHLESLGLGGPLVGLGADPPGLGLRGRRRRFLLAQLQVVVRGRVPELGGLDATVLPLSRAGHHHGDDHRGHNDQQQNPDPGFHGPALLVSGFRLGSEPLVTLVGGPPTRTVRRPDEIPASSPNSSPQGVAPTAGKG